jgi:hypothetical protein
MNRKKSFALGAAVLISAAALVGNAAAAGTSMTVRVEGKTRTLLAAKTVRTHTGFITKGGAPSGACPATSAQGALDVATNHRWSGSFSTSYNEYLIKTILGDIESTSKFYWGIWINDRYATTGACEIKLHAGDRVLFAVDSVAHHEHPIEFARVKNQRSGHPFGVKLVWFSDAGKNKPLAGARVTGSGVSAVTNRSGVAKITAAHAGTLKLNATHAGYIRAATLRVHVS